MRAPAGATIPLRGSERNGSALFALSAQFSLSLFRLTFSFIFGMLFPQYGRNLGLVADNLFFMFLFRVPG